jgi:hypothetical protein
MNDTPFLYSMSQSLASPIPKPYQRSINNRPFFFLKEKRKEEIRNVDGSYSYLVIGNLGFSWKHPGPDEAIKADR